MARKSLENRVATLENQMSTLIDTQNQMASDISAILALFKGQTNPEPPKPAPEKVEFVKKDGTVKLVSAKQAEAWDKYRSREKMTLDEVKAIPAPKFGKKVDAYIKANPSVSAKELKAQFPEMKGMTKEALSDRKVALGVRKAK